MEVPRRYWRTRAGTRDPDKFFAIEAADVRELPEVGLTIAFSRNGP